MDTFSRRVRDERWREMAFPQHWLLAWGGTLYAGADIWVNTLRFAPPPGDGPGIVDETAILADMADDLAAHVQAPDSGYSNRTQLEWVKFNEIDPLGRYVDTGTTHVHEYPTAISGTAGTEYPAQVSLCVSLKTSQARGYASKGRVFVPCCKTMDISGLGTISTLNATNVATTWATFLTNLNNLPGLDTSNIAASVVSKIPVAGAHNTVTGVRVGNVLDTQTNRRNAITETYVDSVVT